MITLKRARCYFLPFFLYLIFFRINNIDTISALIKQDIPSIIIPNKIGLLIRLNKKSSRLEFVPNCSSLVVFSSSVTGSGIIVTG